MTTQPPLAPDIKHMVIEYSQAWRTYWLSIYFKGCKTTVQQPVTDMSGPSLCCGAFLCVLPQCCPRFVYPHAGVRPQELSLRSSCSFTLQFLTWQTDGKDDVWNIAFKKCFHWLSLQKNSHAGWWATFLRSLLLKTSPNLQRCSEDKLHPIWRCWRYHNIPEEHSALVYLIPPIHLPPFTGSELLI